jgi:hypothetical protein
VIENNLNEVSERIRNATPTNWRADISFDSAFIYIERENGKPMTHSDLDFFENAASDIAKLVIEVKQLREINAALKKHIVSATYALEKDIRFL